MCTVVIYGLFKLSHTLSIGSNLQNKTRLALWHAVLAVFSWGGVMSQSRSGMPRSALEPTDEGGTLSAECDDESDGKDNAGCRYPAPVDIRQGVDAKSR